MRDLYIHLLPGVDGLSDSSGVGWEHLSANCWCGPAWVDLYVSGFRGEYHEFGIFHNEPADIERL